MNDSGCGNLEAGQFERKIIKSIKEQPTMHIGNAHHVESYPYAKIADFHRVKHVHYFKPPATPETSTRKISIRVLAAESKFSCEGRTSGYYADVASGCQVYHMCDGLGRQFSYTCPNATLFQQRMLICDHWYMVNCSRSEDDYSANLLIGQKKPFVDDSGSNPFRRTPRPDLLSHPSSETEYNIIYRTGKKVQDKNRINIVGIEQDSSQYGDEDEPTYYPPSHWSTAYASRTSTAKPSRDINANRRNSNQNVVKTSYSSGKKAKPKPKAIDFDSYNRNGNNFENAPKYKNSETKYNAAPTSIPINYRSNFKATTPVFPLNVDESSEPANDVGILPPISYKNSGSKARVQPTPIPVNYKSNFKATTPVFPLNVEESSEPANDVGILPPIVYKNSGNRGRVPEAEQQQVNFRSNFQATTPVFPLTVEDSSAAPNDIGILPPLKQNEDEDIRISQSRRRPQINFESNFKATTPVFPLAVDEVTEKPSDVGILPPLSNQNSNSERITTETPETHVNFRSDFKATTPVFPLAVEDSSVAPNNLGILPPYSDEDLNSNTNIQSEEQVNFKSDFKATTPVFPVTGDDSSVAPNDLGILPPEASEHIQVNFKSNFKATTPVYPVTVEPKNNIEFSSVPLQNESHVNFYSEFKATTPDYPKSVAATSPDPSEAGLIPPQPNNTSIPESDSNSQSNEVPDILLSLIPPEFDANYKKTHENVETTPNGPSLFYQPPRFEPDYTAPDAQANVKPGIEIENIMRSLTGRQWQNIRQRYHIPEYEFPLDDATRPGYEGIINSFGDESSSK
ncbi:hypothetical protein NQ315_010574 [Exocentrus adspersus]|uniref:Chitin-binding type-2 domain-containing protein n=1 Tax=Exocentrus adspersus TaxID=1586481 RepID=A0AAV8W6K7_9CUCU|nr:hypothetical protein NQ315_010574 [Exocentrus adspersus]